MHADLLRGLLGKLARLISCLCARCRNAHAPVLKAFRLAEQAQIGIRVCQSKI